jgi:hypothetical protein
MASLAFLIVYGAVSVSHLRICSVTGAKAWILWIAVILNFGLFFLLLGYTIYTGSASTWITLLGAFALSFVAEAIYRHRTDRRFVLLAPK